MRHLFRLHHLAADPGIRRAAANGEIVRRGDNRAAIDHGSAEQERCGGDAGQLAIFVIVALARNLSDLAETAFVAQRRQPRAGVHLPAPMLPRELFRPAHLLGERFPAAQFIEFF